MSYDAALRRPRRRETMRSAALWGLLGALLVAWFAMAAPRQFGGPATFVIVDGHSMQPMLHTGDLAIARRQAEYRIGDLVVFNFENGLIIHRLIAGNAASGWQTKGDNNAWVDPWTVRNDQVAGKYWREVPGFGRYLAWVNQHSLGFAGACTALALTFYIPWRRKKLAPALTESLARAEKEPRRDGRSNQEYGVLWLSSLAMLAAIALVGLLGMSHQLGTFRGLIAGLALLWSGAFTAYFVYRLYDGRGVPEPSRSMYALSGRLYLVPEFPALDSEVRDVQSAIALRTIAEKYRMPVLHRIDPDTGQHEFLLITVQQGCFRWAPQAELASGKSGAGRGDGARRWHRSRGKHCRPDPKPLSVLAFWD